MNPEQNNKLAADPFDYQITSDGRIRIFRGGKTVKTLGGKAARQLERRLEAAGDDETAIQLVLAKVTGNYKRGNERP